MTTILLIAFYILFPAAILWLCGKYSLFNKIGSVIIAYFFGILVGNIGILPEGFESTQDTLSGATVAIALPLLLFSLDVKAWLNNAGRAILSMLGATIVVVMIAGVGSWVVRESFESAWKFGGLAIGLYTGGTPNLAAIKIALDVDATQFIMMHTYDAVNGIIYLIFVMSVGQTVFNKFLPAYKSFGDRSGRQMNGEDIHSYDGIWEESVIKGLLAATGISVLILGISMGISELIPEEYATASIMLSITSLGIAASFIRRVRSIEKSFQFGMYIILIFSLIVGSMANLKQLVNINWPMMFFVNFVVFGSMVLHAGFCRLMKIDTDTFLITSVSAVCSPPFVPVVAKALNNKEIILSGLTTGIIGYAVGNYLGISFAYIFRSFF